MECKPKEITFTVKQTRYVDVVMSKENGYDMPETVQEVLDLNSYLQSNPADYIDPRVSDWVIDETTLSDLEFKENN